MDRGFTSNRDSNPKEAYSEFKQRNPALKVGFSRFAQLRPRECILAGASGTHTVCVCQIHQNAKLMIVGSKLESYTMGKLSTIAIVWLRCNATHRAWTAPWAPAWNILYIHTQYTQKGSRPSPSHCTIRCLDKAPGLVSSDFCGFCKKYTWSSETALVSCSPCVALIRRGDSSLFAATPGANPSAPSPKVILYNH